jgi:hypothetical protein
LTAPLRSGLGEFYFETARAISSITASGTITKFPNIRWRVSHGAGAFPDISERFLLGFPDQAEAARKAYKERFWYDNAGPVFPKQVKGLTEGMEIPVSQMVFGTVIVFQSSEIDERLLNLHRIIHMASAFGTSTPTLPVSPMPPSYQETRKKVCITATLRPCGETGSLSYPAWLLLARRSHPETPSG